MPLVPCIAKMELTGVCIDIEYSKRLSTKYHNKLEETNKLIDKELENLSEQVEKWKSDTSNKNISKLSDPINLDSPTQLAILLYDILKIPSQSTKSPRGTGEDILKKINNPLCNLVLERRGILKLLNTYIDKLPYCLSPRDNRLHGEFLQFGADTGRFSSKNPNLQNIPAREESIRMMFTASPGYVMIGSDYSQQEPRLLAHYSGDENMINAYKEGKDLYAMIASKVYKNNYEDNLEFNPITKQIQPDGKQRRGSVKSLLLGLMYGMGDKMTASRIGCSIEEAKSIRNDFCNSFPKVEKWINETQKSAHKLGYVEDVWGRRRRLPDILKEKYEISSNIKTFNPFLFSKGQTSKLDKLINDYKLKLSSSKNFNDKNSIIKQANKDGLIVKDNSGFIAQAERQSVNARIQGGSATMSKRAVILANNDEQLNKLGFRLLILVHDEIIGECPEENKEKVKELLSNIMMKAAKPEVKVTMKCDANDFRSWYLDVYSAEIIKEYNLYQKEVDLNNALSKIINSHKECTEKQIKEILENSY